MTRTILASRPHRCSDEGGFTLMEVMATIVVMGILASITIPSWWSVVEARRVDSAANQIAADLRLAHSTASNRLVSWQMVVPSNSSATYQIGPVGGTLEDRTLDDSADGTEIAAATTIIFEADGSATLPGGAPTDITLEVQADDGEPSHTITVSKATSRIQVG